MTTFDINVVKSGRAAVVQVRGELDLSTAPRLREELVSLAHERVPDVTVDLAGLDFIDSSGLQVLVAGLKRCANRAATWDCDPRRRPLARCWRSRD